MVLKDSDIPFFHPASLSAQLRLSCSSVAGTDILHECVNGQKRRRKTFSKHHTSIQFFMMLWLRDKKKESFDSPPPPPTPPQSEAKPNQGCRLLFPAFSSGDALSPRSPSSSPLEQDINPIETRWSLSRCDSDLVLHGRGGKAQVHIFSPRLHTFDHRAKKKNQQLTTLK